MAIIANTVKFLSLWRSLPDLSNMAELAKPTKISSPEQMDPTTVLSATEVKQVLLQAVGQNGVGGTELFAQMTLDTELIAALPENWIYAYYLNARYGRPMPVEMLPIRIGSIYSENVYLLSPLMVCSAILMRLYDDYKNTIDPTKKAQANWLMRCLIQINYLIYRIVKANPAPAPEGKLIVSACTAFNEGSAPDQIGWLDVDQLAIWEQAGYTPEAAVAHWFEFKTQPTF